ncbi:hypothetical protein ABZ215_25000 [Amycolatopsis sp. NPDC006131]|uniref:hypothetical protein n=1 Tax=Amycolatopsis sp. NPDC006131 TaxID=3156731 RepID=UPI0033A70B76
MGTFVATVLLGVTGTPPLIAIPTLIAAALVVCSTASKVVNNAPLFAAVLIENKQTITRLITVATVGHVVWACLYLYRPNLLWLLALAALALTEYAVARGHEYMLAGRAKQELEPATPESAASTAARIDDEVMTAGRKAFRRSGHEWLNILGWEPIDTGDRVIGVAYSVRIPSRYTAKNAAKKLSGEDIEPIAIAFSEVFEEDARKQGQRPPAPLATDWVHIKKEPPAGQYTITVLVVDALATVHEYIDTLEWASIKDPAPIARTLDGKPYSELLAQHWADVGQTRSGKTALIHVKWALITRCHDAVLWVGGVEKLFDAVGPWIEPYLGTQEPLPFDWVAYGAQDTANMLAAAIAVGRWRQSVPHQRRTGFKTIIVQLDEASFFLVLNKIKAVTRDGKMTPSQMAEVIVKGLGSALVFLHLASQRGTNNNWGDCGGDISANIMAQTVFATGDDAEVGRATGDWKLPIPSHKGEFLLKPGDGRPVERLKSEYIQETDPSKPKLHDGATLSDVAWARRHFHSELDPGSQRHAGEHYAKRHRTADALYAYLTNTVAAMLPEHGSAYSDAYAETTAALDAMFAESGIVLEQPTEPEREPEVEAVLSGPRHERIEAIIRSAPGPLGNAEIRAALAAAGDDTVAAQTVTNALRRLLEDGRVKRDNANQYTAA